MVDSFHTLITRTGAALIADAAARGEPFRLATLVAGSRDAAPDEAATAVPDEVWRGPITGVTAGADAGTVVIDAAIPLDDGGFTIRQIGVLDSEGRLIFHASVPEAYKPTRAAGAIRDLAYRLVVRFANAEAVTLLIDPHIVTATRKWTERVVADAIAAHNADPDAHANLKVPNATTEQRGIAELATAAETAAGIDPERVVTPFGLRSALPPVLRPVNRTPADGDTAVYDTPTLTGSGYFSLYGLPQGGAAFEVIGASGETVHAGASDGAGIAYAMPADILTVSTAYSWRCRYRDSAGAWSAWSLPTRFTTAASFRSVVTPTITTPADGSSTVALPLVITTSPFASRGEAQEHAATQVQVATDSGFTDIVHDSGESGDLVRHAVPVAADVFGDTAYHLRARHKGAATGWSDWSPVVAITTAPVRGSQLFTTSGRFTVPAGLRSLCVVCVGGGGGGSHTGGGGGGALAYRNAIAVTPGETIPVTVGSGGQPRSPNDGSRSAKPGGSSSFGSHVSAAGGGAKRQMRVGGKGGPPSVIENGGGGGGGDGGDNHTGGGGGAGGYGGNSDNAGGSGGSWTSQPGADGAGGGGAGGKARIVSGGGGGGGGGGGRGAGAGGRGEPGSTIGGGGGGVGLMGAGASGADSGAGGSSGGNGGKGGSSSGQGAGAGGRYGGGGGGSHAYTAGRGGDGAVRVIWGRGRSFPDNAAED